MCWNMSGEEASLPAGRGRGGLLLRGSRTRSYGSLSRSSLSPVRQRFIEHTVQPEDTLQGLALKYGVSMEQIKRANRLYTNDSIFLKKTLSIPVLSELRESHTVIGLSRVDDDNVGGACCISECNGKTDSSEKEGDGGKEEEERMSDLKPLDFLKRLDEVISQSKQTAVKGCQDAEKRVAALEAACSSSSAEWRPLTRSQSVLSPATTQRPEMHRAAVRTVVKLNRKLRRKEDEIFEL